MAALTVGLGPFSNAVTQKLPESSYIIIRRVTCVGSGVLGKGRLMLVIGIIIEAVMRGSTPEPVSDPKPKPSGSLISSTEPRSSYKTV